jgi:hypothetical protein
MITKESEDIFLELDVAVGDGWSVHQRRADAADELLRDTIGDGIFSTKIDGYSHAAKMTTPFIVKYMSETDTDLNLARLTAWDNPANSAIRYAQWQVDFHWRIDTRPWQYLLYTKFIRRSYNDAILASKMDEQDKVTLMQVSDKFWDEVEVAYVYRSEIIERSRSYAVHPDAGAGSAEHGYTYTKIVPTPDYTFDQLNFELIGPELGAGTSEELRIPDAWPGISTIERTILMQAAAAWLEDAKKKGLADEFLRAKLGDRMVPTRINGWEAGLIETAGFLLDDKDIDIPHRARSESSPEERVSAFARSQYCFMLRLDGKVEDFVELIRLQGRALKILHSNVDDAAIGRLLEDVSAQFSHLSSTNKSESEIVDDDLRLLMEETRPLHPRYAVFDPNEPLPWQTKSPDRYLARMKRLGYTL